jgi:hypothetical protein
LTGISKIVSCNHFNGRLTSPNGPHERVWPFRPASIVFEWWLRANGSSIADVFIVQVDATVVVFIAIRNFSNQNIIWLLSQNFYFTDSGGKEEITESRAELQTFRVRSRNWVPYPYATAFSPLWLSFRGLKGARSPKQNKTIAWMP